MPSELYGIICGFGLGVAVCCIAAIIGAHIAERRDA